MNGLYNFSFLKAQVTMLLHDHAAYGYLGHSTTAPLATLPKKITQVLNQSFTI